MHTVHITPHTAALNAQDADGEPTVAGFYVYDRGDWIGPLQDFAEAEAIVAQYERRVSAEARAWRMSGPRV